ncbi:MAG: peptidase [Betaproteobacteria bacterium]|nr:peptidase [Betaproteobacteria bacterium]NBY04142.1 peptidase [Betaproteobacteria bacterium]
MSVPLPLALPSLPAPADPDLPPVHLGPSEQRPPTLSARALAALSVPGTPQPLAFFNATVRAGFPSPAADHSHKRIDLNDHLVRNREATFLFRVRGDSMTGAGIYDGDTLVIDRSLDARHHHIVLAVVNQEFTVKRLYRRGGVVKLLAENPIYPALVFQPDQELSIWGVVTFNLHKLT